MSRLLKDLSLPAIVAGFLAVLVSYSGPLAILFQAGASAGISDQMMTSWVWAISMGAAVSGIILSIWLKAPVVTAWSAPGTALLVALFPELSLNEAVGAYITAAVIIFIIGVSGTFDTFVRAIPKGIAAGMMAGILFQFGVGAFTAIETTPALAIGMLLSYVVFRRLFPKYTLILLLIAGVILAVVLEGASLSGVRWSIAVPQFIEPEWNLGSTLSLAIPLVLVSLTGQFLPGMAILQGAGYSVRAKPIIGVTSLVSLPMAFFGGITTVVAAITAAICTGKDAHEDPSRRYVAGVFNGVFYLVGGLFAGTIVSLFTSLPAAFVAVLAGLALLGAIAGNLFAALEDASHREASLITFIVTASGMSVFGLSSAFWGVVIGYGCYLVLNGSTGRK
ncbi:MULTISPECIES: benzoate/H(+) symporter BenE family transporter [Marinobacter]|jgi:benzoate membrane transport protein|uniref:benzoate/H(+) symporter BenE family transporter n=1 Tax=Marinobacter TaxID=2742 RepID=UPI000FC99C61|nr:MULTISPECIES: benzoate/H(+) symporter BenE family transporter [Marinobacter]MCZ4284353.1 benzoate/H(+) symporter BenE family transporter [Marinobacter salarius]MDC8454415.1 benzoate/H(+) symporter BenE family transporter [Marinobacter sp. DS40M6]MDM8178771.1 benzoate/H(+) symporter BenE family transporter [Marinobacter salarius]RUT77209.1 benzoate transporter BenE [Marinobacter sp. NP-6]VVT16499.1 Benzoate membrane transport protein [Marinobacter salarius]